ncbi:hypothetical protein MWU75_08150 [Ornithinimicrobium sp. F0845]|uniref:hypothetical protein n=1 Tax=Ornithinimicrobium sp. F0845 TaxID=2926412 RepID=UPI001FF4BCDD|nr:hypothetical protein [Ornithinimicrobium sp. F0845]MCK0112105.1 hypothetical protein [Ornithinimicrobium sp. F0845]
MARSDGGRSLPALRSRSEGDGGGSPRARRRLRLRDRLFTGLCVLAALAVVLFALSRGNPRAAAIGGGLFLGYAVLHAVVRRLEPAARLVTGHEADDAERLVQFRATRTAGQVALLVAVVGVALTLFADWDTGLWVAGTAVVVVASFVGALWWFGRN